jgi:hypothetical protein
MRGDARRQSCNTAIASFARATEPGAWHQPQDRSEVAQTCDSRILQDWAEGTTINGPDRSRGGDHRRIQTAYIVAAGRLPLCSAAVHPAFDAFGAASVPSAAWHLALA